MIAWYWLIPVAMLAGCIGAVIAAACSAEARADEQIGINDPSTTPRPPAARPQGDKLLGENKVHHLKTWPEYFNAICCGDKTFEVRKNDRDFQVGDKLVLEEYDPATGYTGQTIHCRVKYILNSIGFPGYVVMSIKALWLAQRRVPDQVPSEGTDHA